MSKVSANLILFICVNYTFKSYLKYVNVTGLDIQISNQTASAQMLWALFLLFILNSIYFYHLSYT